MTDVKIIGVDLGATNVRGAVVYQGQLSAIAAKRIRSNGPEEHILEDIYEVIDELTETHPDVQAIGIGVPSIVDVAEGIVYDVLNIPSWREVHLKEALQNRYNLSTYVNNDANCFAVGEYHYGKGQGTNSMIGLIMGTGLGAGVIINKHLYSGHNCGAGEFGFFPYRDSLLEYHATGSFFSVTKKLDGEEIFNRAKRGEPEALELYRELGLHVGYAIKMVMYTFDPELIVLGGSVRHAFPYFQQTMWQEINTFAFKRSVDRLRVEVSELHNSALIGAAALYIDSQM
ncbi:ROK family protein [Mucilaginibacter agri]|uniref:ROK family protein n=1 Tax=Mucilaginibacter agri TaxID=2695265 RepID=A0A965ZMX2_9SPHI|nr:ROK family protein [Mucilaginibacter agri]NCD72512.1 ROK family protein [Mucilaginibacter agri]